MVDIQTRTQADMSQIKSNWQTENETIVIDYQNQTNTTRQQGEQTIQQTVLEGEQEADQVLNNAENQAVQKKQIAEAKAESLIRQGQTKAASHLNGVGLTLSGGYEASAVGSIMRKEEEGTGADDEAAREAAKKKAEEEMFEAIKQAQEELDQMEAEVEAILNDASLTAAEKVEQVNQVVEDTINDVNTIIEGVHTSASGWIGEILANYQETIIEERLDQAIVEVSEALVEDETVAARIEEIQTAIADGTGNILIDTSNLDSTSFIGLVRAAVFRIQMVNNLNQLMTRPAGLELIMNLMDGDHTVTITADESDLASATPSSYEAFEKDDGTAGTGSDSTVNMHPNLDDDDIVLFDDAGNDIPAPVWLILGHELIHALHNSEGRNTKLQEDHTIRRPVTHDDYHDLEEDRTIESGDLTENDLREQFDVSDPRHGHGGRIDDDPRN